MNAEHCKAYTLLQEQQIDDIHAHGYLLRHNKSGARVLLLENEELPFRATKDVDIVLIIESITADRRRVPGTRVQCRGSLQMVSDTEFRILLLLH